MRPVHTALVPNWEQAIQAGQLGALYSFLDIGDRYLVLTISKDINPLPYGSPSYRHDPDGKLIPVGHLIYHRDHKPQPTKIPIPNFLKYLLLYNQVQAIRIQNALNSVGEANLCGCRR